MAQSEKIQRLREALGDLLDLVEASFQWATEGGPCDGSADDLCTACRACGCIRIKIDNARAVLKTA